MQTKDVLKEKNLTYLALVIPKELKRKLKIEAATMGKTITEIVIGLIEKHLA